MFNSGFFIYYAPSMVERGDKTSYEIEKAIIEEVAERSNTTEQRTVSVS